MTESERDLLMPFLRKLIDTRSFPSDQAANNLIHTALGKQPNATYLLVQRALTLECELAAAQRRIDLLEGKPPTQERHKLAVDFLNPSAAGWGEVVTSHAPVTTSKRLYDFFKQAKANKEMDLESRAISFIGRNSAKIWLSILVLSCVVVFMKQSGNLQ